MKDISVFAIDIGGTRISGAIFNSSRQILSRKSTLIMQAQLVSELGSEAEIYGAGYLVKEPRH